MRLDSCPSKRALFWVIKKTYSKHSVLGNLKKVPQFSYPSLDLLLPLFQFPLILSKFVLVFCIKLLPMQRNHYTKMTNVLPPCLLLNEVVPLFSRLLLLLLSLFVCFPLVEEQRITFKNYLSASNWLHFRHAWTRMNELQSKKILEWHNQEQAHRDVFLNYVHLNSNTTVLHPQTGIRATLCRINSWNQNNTAQIQEAPITSDLNDRLRRYNCINFSIIFR